MPWRKMLAYITRTVDQELLLRNEYLAAENRILRAKIRGRLLLTDPERTTLARIGKRLGDIERYALTYYPSAVKSPRLVAAAEQGRVPRERVTWVPMWQTVRDPRGTCLARIRRQKQRLISQKVAARMIAVSAATRGPPAA